MELSREVVNSLAYTAYITYLRGWGLSTPAKFEELPERMQEVWRLVATELLVACRNCQTKQLLEAQHESANK